MRPSGIYEQLINEQLNQELCEIPENRKSIAQIDKAEASQILSQYIADVVRSSLEKLADKGNSLEEQVDLVNRVIEALPNETARNSGRTELDEARSQLSITQPGEQLLALVGENDPMLALGKSARDLERPETSMIGSSLFTGSPNEPQMNFELRREITSADRIDMLVSFIKWSGLRLLIDDLRAFTQRGGQLRVITTSYMGATDSKAVEELRQLPNTEIRVSYDTKRTRLHAKAYVFYRETGFTTAYVGSSNMSHAAMTSGLEWNLKITAHDQPDTMQKIAATFESYWNMEEFELYGEDSRERLKSALKAERTGGTFGGSLQEGQPTFFFDIRPYSYQQEILDRLEAQREIRGRYHNLVVAATGTGKTVIAAFDYLRFCTFSS